jgi:hypothetical protein
VIVAAETITSSQSFRPILTGSSIQVFVSPGRKKTRQIRNSAKIQTGKLRK